MTYLENFSVSDSFLERVKESIGYPLVDTDTLSELFDDNWIKENICAREAEQFFNFFPLVVNVPINVSGTAEVSVEAPKNTLGIVHSAFVESGGGNNNLMSGNPFFTSSIVSVASSIARNSGTAFDWNSWMFSRSHQQFFNKALQNSDKSFYAYFDEVHHKLIAKSTLSGTVSIDAGCYAESVDMIPKRLRTKYLELCQSALAIRFARTLQMQNSDLPLSIDVSAILEENKEIHENLTTWMQQNSTYCIMR